MIWTIVHKEVLTSLRTFRFGVSAVLCMLLIPTSLFVFGKRYQHNHLFTRLVCLLPP